MRWRKFAGVEDLWARVLQAEERHRGSLGERSSPKEFIQTVLSARYGVTRLIAYESAVKEKFAELKAEFAECIEAADSPAEIGDAISEFKPKFETLGRAIYDFDAATAVSRKDQNGSRTRKAFVLRMRSYFLRRCGREMDDVMSLLLDIVFKGKSHSQDDARMARRLTTKAGRRRR